MRLLILLLGFLLLGTTHADADVRRAKAGTLNGISPNSAARGATLTVTITGNNTAFKQGSSTVGFFKSGTSTAVTINSIIVNTTTSMTASITVKANAITGAYDVRVYSPADGNLTLFQSFTVTGPSITSVSPSVVTRGAKLSLTISGSNTHFDQGTGTSVQFFRQGSPTSFIQVDSTRAITSNNLRAYVAVGKFAPGGLYDIRAFNTADNEIIHLNSVSVASPFIASINPNTTVPGRTLEVMISGKGTNFTQASPTDFGFRTLGGLPAPLLQIDSVRTPNDSLAMLRVTVDPATPTANYFLVYSNAFDGVVQTMLGVSPGPASIISVTPTTAKRGQTLDVAISGVNTGFMQSSATNTIAFKRNGSADPAITVNTLATVSDNLMVANISIDTAASSMGTYSIHVWDTVDGDMSSVPIYFSVLNTGLADIQSEPLVTVYPNPAREDLFVQSAVPLTRIGLFDLAGRMVYNQEKPFADPDGRYRIAVHKAGLRPGFYLVRAESRNRSTTVKVFIE